MKAWLKPVESDESPAAGDDELRPIAEHQEFREASTLLGKLGSEIAAIEREITGLQAANYLQNETAAGRTPNAAPGTALAEAQRLLAGGEIDFRSDAERIALMRARVEKLRAGGVEQAKVVERIRDRLNVDASRRMRDRHRRALRDLFSACRLVARAAAAERAVFGELIEKGYEPSTGILPPAEIGAVQAFNEHNDVSQISHFKKQLEALGVPDG